MTLRDNRKRIKYRYCILLGLLVAGLLYAGWTLTRPVEIVAVYQDNDISHVLVRHFSLTDRGRLDWWDNNKAMLKKTYGIPKPERDGSYDVIVWDFGEGYQIEKPDNTFFPSKSTDHLRCFEEIKVPERCIRKERLVWIAQSSKNGFWIHVGGHSYWRKDDNKPFIKQKRAEAH